MNDNKGTGIWQWAVLLLVLCNTGLIVTMWLKPHREGPPRGISPRDQVISSLKFNDEQVKKYDVLVRAHQEEMRKLRDEGSALREALFSNLNNSIASSKIADSLAMAIGNNQKAIELVTFNHFSQVRALCTDLQKQEFDKIIVGITKNMTGGPGGHRPPPPGEGGQDREHDGPPPPPDGRPGPPPPPQDGR